VAIGDLNGDGKADLAVANSGSADVAVLLGTGFGTFSLVTSLGAGPNPRSVAVGDLNGDGTPDLAVANSNGSNVSVLLNAPTADRSPSGLTFGSGGSPVAQGTISAPQTVTATNNGSAPLVVSGFAVSGANPGDFFTSNDSCHSTIAPGSACTVQVRFGPQAQGARAGTLTVLTNAPANPTVSLAGTAGPLPQGPTGPTGPTGPIGPIGPIGPTGPVGENGNVGPQGPQGGTGPQGSTGSNGNNGAQGPKGDTGPQGRPGRDAKVTCRIRRLKRTRKVKVTCKVVLARRAATSRVRWRLLRGGRTVARGTALARHHRFTLELGDFARLRPGRYTLRIAGRRYATTIVIGG
jgi:hypothetical protein